MPPEVLAAMLKVYAVDGSTLNVCEVASGPSIRAIPPDQLIEYWATFPLACSSVSGCHIRVILVESTNDTVNLGANRGARGKEGEEEGGNILCNMMTASSFSNVPLNTL